MFKIQGVTLRPLDSFMDNFTGCLYEGNPKLKNPKFNRCLCYMLDGLVEQE
jgi:hypothetical protein